MDLNSTALKQTMQNFAHRTSLCALFGHLVHGNLYYMCFKFKKRVCPSQHRRLVIEQSLLLRSDSDYTLNETHDLAVSQIELSNICLPALLFSTMSKFVVRSSDDYVTL